ncbi:MAG: dihydrolipoyl dehydrogenase [Acidobacteria bacterium]|nr:MAG: dihydrolipoyl dehydrogenase [Acidobacteriota bacterium]
MSPTTTQGPATRDGDLETEVVVLGSGPGGYAAAFRAADLGKKVVLVERYATLGGVCLNVGCIPSKALLHAAELIDEAAAFADHGIVFGPPRIDRAQLRRWKDGVVGRLTKGLATMARQRGVTVVEGRGRFAGPHALAVETAGGERTVAFEHAVVAVGSRAARLPGLPYDDPRVLDSTRALELPEASRLLVVGGGIIGLEMATVYHALGARITVVELLDDLLPGVDRDLVRPLERRLAKRYDKILLGTRVSAVEARADGLHVTFDGPQAPAAEVFDAVLVAVGRRPNGGTIEAEKAGVRVDERGFIPADEQQRTNVPHVFAIGDVAGEPMLAHKATHQGKVAAEVIAGHKAAFDARVVPSVAYTDPEVAWCGVSEREAEARGIACEAGTFPWSASGRALALGRSEGKTKLLFEAGSKRLIGAGIVGPRAGDLIAEVALAIEMGADAEDVGLTVHPHPTLSETVAFAAEAVAGTLTDLYLPRKR